MAERCLSCGLQYARIFSCAPCFTAAEKLLQKNSGVQSIPRESFWQEKSFAACDVAQTPDCMTISEDSTPLYLTSKDNFLSNVDCSVRRDPMSLPQALKILESEGRIDNLRSQCDNAISLIDSVLLLNLTDLVRASLVYALDVLKSDSTVTAVPVG